MKSARVIISICLAWAFIVIDFQALATSLAVVLISWGSGPAQGIHRYVLGAPAVFVALAKWGGNPVFDRAWTILSILLMGLNATLFAFNMWVA